MTPLHWFLFGTITFFILAKIAPCNPGMSWWNTSTKGKLSDLTYYFVIPTFLTSLIRIGLLLVGARFLLGFTDKDMEDFFREGYGPLSELPLYLQAVLIFMVSDFLLYWIHRGFHSRSMWRYHAVHHSSKELDWMSSARFHPVNVWLEFTAVDVCMLLAGFSPMALASLVPLNIVYSFMVHANLRWTFGPLKYVFASPVFHRWHHTAANEGGSKNFAPTFPFIDLMFGTFYMPEGKLPERYGVNDPDFPEGLAGQLLYPFPRLYKKPEKAEGSKQAE